MNGKFWKFYDDREDDYLLPIDDEEKQSDREVNVNQGFGCEFRVSEENALRDTLKATRDSASEIYVIGPELQFPFRPSSLT